MACCTTGCQKWTSFGFSLGFLISGFLLIFGWESLFNTIVNYELSLQSGTFQYKAWLHTPIDVYMNIYAFTWENAEECLNSSTWVKPRYKELGPYTYSLSFSRANVKFNDNDTISYNTIRTYKFVPEKSFGTEDDTVVLIHPVQLTIAAVLKDKHYIIQRGVHYFFKKFNLTLDLKSTIRSLTFEGISHPALDIALRLKLMDGWDVPYDKFGWFYPRNGSETYEGDYTTFTGEDNIRKAGIVDEWNHSKLAKAYTGECARIDGSTGEVFHPIHDDPTFSLFQSDFCGVVTLERNGSDSVDDIEGNLYVSSSKMFDNGTRYPERACFNPSGAKIENGLRDISGCQHHAPAFISLPHFYLGDSSLIENIDGMNPDPEKHKMFFLLEPSMGIPLKAHISFQGNLKMYQVENIDMFKNVKEIVVPMMWAQVDSGMPDSYGPLIKFSHAAPTIGLCLGYVFVVLSVILVSWGAFLEIRGRKGEVSYSVYLRNMFSKKSISVTPLTSADAFQEENNSV